MEHYLVRFEPTGHIALAEAGETVLTVARRASFPLLASCGGRSNCGTCAVRIVSGVLAAPGKNEQILIDTSKVRLGCRARIAGDVTLKPVIAPRGETYKVTEEVPDELALAVDLGTTNLSLVLIDPKTKHIYARSSALNVQAAWGGDVLSRLSLAIQDELVAEQLEQLIQQQITDMLKTLVTNLSSITSVIIAGNTVMAGLLVGADLKSLGVAPFIAPQSYELKEGPLFEALGSNTNIEVLNPLAAFVGGDTRALLTVVNRSEPTLLIDIGTNIECAYLDKERLICGSAPAGSAFAELGRQGSDLLNFIQKLLRIEALSREGLLNEEHYRVTRNEEGILLASISGQVLTQLELREIQLGKAALALLVEGILKTAGTKTSQIKKLLITGAFGTALSLDLLYDIAILPQELRQVEQTEILTEGVVHSVFKMLVNEYPALDRDTLQLVNIAEDAHFSENYFKALNF